MPSAENRRCRGVARLKRDLDPRRCDKSARRHALIGERAGEPYRERQGHPTGHEHYLVSERGAGL